MIIMMDDASVSHAVSASVAEQGLRNDYASDCEYRYCSLGSEICRNVVCKLPMRRYKSVMVAVCSLIFEAVRDDREDVSA